MEISSTHRLRNRLFMHFFGFASLLHFIMNEIVQTNVAFYAPVFGLLAYVIIFVLSFRRKNERFIKLIILLSLNAYIFIFNLEALSSIALIYFIIPIVASAFYNDSIPIIVLAAVTFAEVLLLTLSLGQLDKVAPPEYINLSIITFISITLLIAFLHTLFFSKLWKQLELKNASMEKALLSKEGYLHLFFKTAKDAIAVFDADNKIIAINPAFEELYGWTSEECIGKQIDLYSPYNAEEAQARTKKVQNGQSYSLLETEEVKKDGSTFPAQITLSPIFDRFGNVVATSVISRDITYQKETEKMILQSEKLKLAGEIAAGVAHEIRNPMTVISGFVQMMQQDPNHQYPEYTRLIQSELERINLIISEFLVLAKPQAPSLKEISLREILNDILLLFHSELNLKGMTLREMWNEKDFVFTGEEHHLKQVFINILKNAIEASERNGEIALAVENTENGFVSIRFSDAGAGIPIDEINKIFEPFYTTKETGTGLGLLISQKIVQEHGGTLKISSEEGQGTIAEILLPLNQKGA